MSRTSRRTTARALIAALLLSLPVHLSGQADQAASIDGILDLGGTGSPRTLRGPTDRVQVTRAGTSDWVQASLGMGLFRADRVLVGPRTIARLAIRAGEARGEAHLSSSLLTRTESLVVESIGGADQALYEIQDAPRELGDLQLAVVRGSLALKWVQGRLLLFTAGIRAVVSGTELILTTSEDGQRAVLHLIEGEVTFPDFPGIVLPAGRVAILQVGLPPVVQPPLGPTARMPESGEWTTDRAWPRRLYEKPVFWVGAGAGVLAAIQVVRMVAGDDGGDGGPRRSGTIILRIPF